MNPAFKSGEHVVVTDRKELHCGLEDNVPFPEYYTAEVKNRYDYYPFGMLMEERKYGAATCIYDIDTTIVFTVIDQDFAEDPNLDAWLYAIAGATPNYDNSSMLLEYDQDPLVTYWPANEGDRYKVTFSFTFDGNCDSLQVLGNVQNSTTQSYTSSGTYTFDFTVNDVSGGYGVFGFYKDNPECIVYIHSVKIEQYTTSTQVVCDTDSVAGYRYGFNGKSKDDEIYEIEGTAYDFGARLYDSRIGRFLSCDPLEAEYTWQSTYAFAANKPIALIDEMGMGPDDPNDGGPKPTEVGTKEGQSGFTAVNTYGINNAKSSWQWKYHTGSNKYSAGWYSPTEYKQMIGSMVQEWTDAGQPGNFSKFAGISQSVETDEGYHDAIYSAAPSLYQTTVASRGDASAGSAVTYDVHTEEYGFKSWPASGAIQSAEFEFWTTVYTGSALTKSVASGVVRGSSMLSGGKTFAQYKAARGGTETLAHIQTSTGVQRISTEFHHMFITQRAQRAYNLPNWMVK